MKILSKFEQVDQHPYFVEFKASCSFETDDQLRASSSNFNRRRENPLQVIDTYRFAHLSTHDLPQATLWPLRRSREFEADVIKLTVASYYVNAKMSPFQKTQKIIPTKRGGSRARLTKASASRPRVKTPFVHGRKNIAKIEKSLPILPYFIEPNQDVPSLIE
jgi:hypothetical protein